MRRLVDAARIRALLQALGEAALDADCRVYLTGGATAVLHGWRAQTIDVDIKVVPDSDRLLQAIPSLKERLEINVELAAPGDFIPELPGWETRSAFIARHGRVSFYHYDLYSQALAKLERAEEKDLADVERMLALGLIVRRTAWTLFRAIVPLLYRYPAVDPREFEASVRTALGPEA